MPVIGFISGRAPNEASRHVAAFRSGLPGIGYIEGRNVAIEYRWTEGQTDACPISRRIWSRSHRSRDCLWSARSSGSSGQGGNNDMPIVFVTGDDPVSTWPRREPQPARR